MCGFNVSLLMTSRTLPRTPFFILLACVCLSASPLVGQSPTPDPWREFPSYESQLIWRMRQGADTKEAARLLKEAPASLETFTKLAHVNRLDDALEVLKRALENADALQTVAALNALQHALSDFQRDPIRSYSDTIRQLVVPLRARIATLPREDAARLTWVILSIDQWLGGRNVQDGNERRAQFFRDYDGTEAALLAEVDLLQSNPRQILQEIAELDQFAKAHPGTNAGAKALFREGFQLHVNVPMTGVEPRGGDPTDRLVRVAAIVKELESGKFPKNEWVDQAPSLMVGFFVPSTPPPTYSPANLDRAIETYTAFVKDHLGRPGGLDSLENSLGYVISSKLGDLFQLNGDRVGGIERTLDELEKTAPDPGLIRLVRAQYYARQSTAGPEADRPGMAAKARTALTALASSGGNIAARRALAFEAAFDYYQRDYARAMPEYQEYVARYPSSPWAPIAALRVGECFEEANDWQKSAEAYARAAATYASEPVAVVLGNASASRALDAQGRFEESLAAATRGLNGWDSDYGVEYTIASSQAQEAVSAKGPAVYRLPLKRDDLSVRVATLARDLKEPGGRLLARGRWLLDQKQFAEAIKTLKDFQQREPRSTMLSEARLLLHRAQFEVAVDLGNVEGPHYEKTKAAAALDAIGTEPFDSVVATANLARAAMMLTEGHAADAEGLTTQTLDSWTENQRDLTTHPPAAGIEADIAEIRRVVFRPLGDPIYSGMWTNAVTFPTTLPRIIIVCPDVSVKTADGQINRHTVYQKFPDLDHVLFLKTDDISLLSRILPTMGGTKRRVPTAVMETPNQPVGSSMDILKFWNRFFPARPGHWGGWELETYPRVTQIEFVNVERTKANAAVTIGYSGATVVLEKIDGNWRALKLVGQWVT
jgi:TolA-binding protein